MSKLSVIRDSLAGYVVRDLSGNVDVDATCAQFASDLSTYETETRASLDEIAVHVDSVFDERPGDALLMRVVVSGVLQRMNPQSTEAFLTIEKRTEDYIRANADVNAQKERKLANGTIRPAIVAEPPRTRKFHIGLGQGGGVWRWSDRPEKPVEKSAS